MTRRALMLLLACAFPTDPGWNAKKDRQQEKRQEQWKQDQERREREWQEKRK